MFEDIIGNFRQQPDRRRAQSNYASFAPEYDASCKNIEQIRVDALKLIDLKEGDTVLDIACGTGPLLQALAHQVGPDGKVIGVELSADMAKLAQQRAATADWGKQVSLKVMAAEDIQLDDRADAIMMMFTHDVLQSPAAIQRLLDHAKPGAKVIIAGLRFLPWIWAAPLNIVSGYRARRYLTTWRGLEQPWAAMLPHLTDFRIEKTYWMGTCYLATAVIKETADVAPASQPLQAVAQAD